jgi:hypothetical protein
MKMFAKEQVCYPDENTLLVTICRSLQNESVLSFACNAIYQQSINPPTLIILFLFLPWWWNRLKTSFRQDNTGTTPHG